jgi:hypothetical protein
MPQLIKPGTVKIMTQDGEVQVSITLELNINLNSAGLQVTAAAQEIKPKEEEKKFTEWAIPDFGSTKIDFGKRE